MKHSAISKKNKRQKEVRIKIIKEFRKFHIPNVRTIQAINDTREGKNLLPLNNFEDLLK